MSIVRSPLALAVWWLNHCSLHKYKNTKIQRRKDAKIQIQKKVTDEPSGTCNLVTQSSPRPTLMRTHLKPHFLYLYIYHLICIYAVLKLEQSHNGWLLWFWDFGLQCKSTLLLQTSAVHCKLRILRCVSSACLIENRPVCMFYKISNMALCAHLIINEKTV